MSGRPLAHDRRRDAARARVPSAIRRHLRGSSIAELAARLKALDFGNAIVLFGAALLLSVLPLIILLSSLADERIDDDLSRHLGLDSRGAHIVRGLFRTTPSHSAGSIVLGLLIAFAGTMAVASSLQRIYVVVFGQQQRGWRDLPRFVIWVAGLLLAVTGAAAYDNPLRQAVGPVARALVSFVLVMLFIWWTMHFLLAGQVPWRQLIRPAFVTSLLWLGLALFSSVYFSSAIISEHRLYGTIGVVFILLTWFIAIGAVVVLGAAWGAVWQDRAQRRARGR
jgi:membrane protein